MGVFKSTKVRIHLVIFKGLLEINGNLSAYLSKSTFLHVILAGFTEKEVLSLSKAQVRAHTEAFLWEVDSGFTWRELCDLSHKVFENPCGLLEECAGFLSSFSRQIHVASLSHTSDSEIVKRWVHLKQRHWWHLFLFGERIIPCKLQVDICLELSKGQILIETIEVFEVIKKDCSKLFHLVGVGLVCNDLGKAVMG